MRSIRVCVRRSTGPSARLSNDYHFVTRWRVQGTVSKVYDLLSRAVDLPRWWPSVYLDVQELEQGDPNGIGKVVSLHTRGWLPYTLR